MTTKDPSPLLRPFYPALDGLRAIAFLLVFSFHYCRLNWDIELWRWGWVGVDLFFCLSGFLITGILYDSLHRPDYFRNFYIRRALRIFPLFYTFWVVLLLLTPLFHVVWNRYNVAMAFYLGNFFVAGAALHPDPGLVAFHPPLLHVGTRNLLINHFWSLCVEEQFYLIWPAVLWLVRRRRHMLRLCAILLIVFPVFRLLFLHLYPEALKTGVLYFNTFSRADSLIAGAAVALWLRGEAGSATILGCPSLENIRRFAILLLTGSSLVLALSVALEPGPRPLSIYDPVVSTVGFTLVALAAVGILLLTIEPSSPLITFLQLRPLVAMGRISYGMYFIHELLFDLAYHPSARLKAHHLLFLLPIYTLVATFALAWLSFRFIESPFLRLKSRLAPRPGAINDPPPDPGPLHLAPEPS